MSFAIFFVFSRPCSQPQAVCVTRDPAHAAGGRAADLNELHILSDVAFCCSKPLKDVILQVLDAVVRA
jgi:hypothetical protein